MPSFIRSEQAENDLLLIWEYIADDNKKAADKIVRMIDERCVLLAEHPRLGPARPDLGNDLRYFPVGSYLILYRERPDGVEIVRVLHSARNLEAIFHADD
ncbi:MAG: type II toxin-antitoxin system RelE/ParE family toxin [Alphaproteobacteria bacterium]|nr:type II toxin-antitoxin system RelE/ParE family toxin [Alphaproteobacteria bacterium]